MVPTDSPLARVMEPIAAAGAVLHASDAASQTQVTNALLNWEPLAAVAASCSPLHAAQKFPSNWGGPFFSLLPCEGIMERRLAAP